MEQYTCTGVNKPPYCEMTLRATDGSTPPDLTLPVTLTGVKQPTTITLEREAQKSDGDICKELSLSSERETGIAISFVEAIHVFTVLFNLDTYDSTKYLCQVLYHKEGTNHWKITVAFLSSKQRLVSKYKIHVIRSDLIGLIFSEKRVSHHSIKMQLLAQLQNSSSRKDPAMLQSKLMLTRRQQQS